MRKLTAILLITFLMTSCSDELDEIEQKPVETINEAPATKKPLYSTSQVGGALFALPSTLD